MPHDTTTSEKPALAEKRNPVALLKRRVMRRPASLGGYHYYLEIGERVYITGCAGGVPRVSSIAVREARASEDYFSVQLADLEIIERGNDPLLLPIVEAAK